MLSTYDSRRSTRSKPRRSARSKQHQTPQRHPTTYPTRTRPAKLNRNCRDLDLKQCINQSITSLKNFKIVGRGTSGILITAESNKGLLAIKFIFRIKHTSSYNFFTKFESELEFTYAMSELGIGPEIFDTFHYNFPFRDLQHYPTLAAIFELIEKHHLDKGHSPYSKFSHIYDSRKKEVSPGSLSTSIQCIVMRAYESDCAKALTSDSVSFQTKQAIINKMVKLIQEQIDAGVYCYDVKSQNFVVNLHPQLDVKMIDFGADFCTTKNIYKWFNNDDPVPYLDITFLDLLFISNVLQTFMLYSKTPYIKRMDRDKSRLLLAEFVYNDQFGYFFTKNWQAFIDFYVDMAANNYKNGASDPSNIVVWYSNPLIGASDDKIYSDENLDKIKFDIKFELGSMVCAIY